MMGALGVKGQSNQGLFKKGKAVDLAQSLKRILDAQAAVNS